MTAEGGKPVVENVDEVGWTAAALDYYAEIGRDSAGHDPLDRVDAAVDGRQGADRDFGCIVPWNYPLLLLSWKIAPALATGNTVVCKPSELTPLSTLMLAGVLRPPSRRCDQHPRGRRRRRRRARGRRAHRRVAFTGSVETGKRIAAACAERIARVNLEMGGKDPFIVSDVADRVGVAAKGGAWAAFLNAGQVCTSAERFYVMDDVYDAYLEAIVDYRLVVGDPTDSNTDIGPMVSAPQRQKVVDQVEAAVAAGAEVVLGGGNGGHERGHFFSPVVITGAPSRPICCTRRRSAPSRRSYACAASTRRSSSRTRPGSGSARTSRW